MEETGETKRTREIMKFAQNYQNTYGEKYPLAGSGKRKRRRAYSERISHRSDVLNGLDSSRPVIVKWPDGRARRYASIQAASDSMGISRDTLHYQLRRKTASRLGYTISYIKEAVK